MTSRERSVLGGVTAFLAGLMLTPPVPLVRRLNRDIYLLWEVYPEPPPRWRQIAVVLAFLATCAGLALAYHSQRGER